LILSLAEVLEESEERTYLIQDLRSRIIQRTAGRGLQQRELLETVFKEIDLDGSGEIDGAEFKSLLVKMDMGYSGKKFSRLYRAIDRDGDGSLSLAELNHLLFPDDAKKREVEEQGLKIQSRLDRRITALESEQQAESSGVSLGAHRKRLGQISSLKSLSESTWKQTVGTIPTPIGTDLAQPPGDPIIREEDDGRSSTNLSETERSKSPPPPLPMKPLGTNHSPSESKAMEAAQIGGPLVDLVRTQSLPPIVHRGSHLSASTSHGSNSRARNLAVNSELPIRANSFDESPSNQRFSSPKYVVSQSLLSTDSAQKKKFPQEEEFPFHDPNDFGGVSPAPPVRPPHDPIVERVKRHLRDTQGIHLNRKIGPSPEGDEIATGPSPQPPVTPGTARRPHAQILI
jgi:hypothetical protein